MADPQTKAKPRKKRKRRKKKKRPSRRRKSALSESGISGSVAIARIKESKLKPSSLTTADRKQVVEYAYFAKGLHQHVIAGILGKNVRTIARDVKELRERHAAQVDPLDMEMFIQDLRAKSERLFQMAVRNDTPGVAMAIWCRMIDKLQSLGLLPKVAQTFKFIPQSDEDLAREDEMLDALIAEKEIILDAEFEVQGEEETPGGSEGGEAA